MRNELTLWGVAAALAVGLAACGASEEPNADGNALATACTKAGDPVECTCADGTKKATTCISDRRANVCPCFGNGDPSKSTPSVPWMSGTGGAGAAVAGTGGSTTTTGAAGTGPAGTGGETMMTPGTGGMPAPMGTGGTPGMSGTGGGGADPGMPTGTEEIERLRQVCVDKINEYRATVAVTPPLEPLMRGTPNDETCSDMGAKKDGDSGQAHGSAGDCMGYGGQDTCPGWPVGGNTQFGGYATVEAALLGCLQAMWDEGEPPVSRAECQKDYQGCFLKYGHYLNMSDPSYTGVICGFYLMEDGKSWWMNQDFKSKPWGAP